MYNLVVYHLRMPNAASQPRFRRPAMLDAGVAAYIPGGIDPARRAEMGHITAAIIMHQTRTSEDPEMVARLLNLVEDQGIDTLAEIWAYAEPDTLPGALWRLYSLQQTTRNDGERVAHWYKLGLPTAQVAGAVAGVVEPPTSTHLNRVIDEVLSGFFTGDLAVALERAAAYARVLVTGIAFDADAREVDDAALSSSMTKVAANLQLLAAQFDESAKLWRNGELL